ncbi:hypothetical protein DSM106972_047520 [Dulcicalothrix desertica PCC 7102]|uniref:Uncharacterized protein n=1 Tax=Dulcicalothrix desertica PCC 7102 TaxID=232991 RepID=A0A3S1CB98_9CYAN|nr:DUF6753 family protein [Dulcicalothrix desertica]RUT03838.1 hypothetical protein DSM106972_047520 [Dulcicalothrix desertica PCC 7102]TWH43753.1 hypothetical protein CAL7102_07497 [Dulcicalothrix desertica PCC 7102]
MVHTLRQAKNESFLNRLLEGKDADFQRRVLAITVEHGLSTSDPLFLVMLATGQLQVLLEDKPNELEGLFERWSTALYDHLEKTKQAMEEQKRISLKGLEVEIGACVQRLIKKAESKQQSRLKVMLPALGLIVAATGFGVLAGLSVPVWLAGGYAPLKPRLLTVSETETLSWANSSQGKLARNISIWNSESLTNLYCTKASAQNSLVARERGQKRISDYCLLRVKAP